MEQSNIDYIHLQVKSFRKCFIQSTSRRNFDDIHDYRVALKRLQTLVNFIKRIPGGENLKRSYKINNLGLAFRSGGILREMQINRILLARFELASGMKYSKFRSYMRFKERHALADLRKAREKFSASKLKKFENKVKLAIRGIPEALFFKYIDEFIVKKIAQIKELVKDQNVESTLHRIRKHTKSIKYLLEMSRTDTRRYGDLKFEVDKITELEDLIGNWHDQLIFKIYLEKYISSVQKRKTVDAQTQKLLGLVERDYVLTFKKTVQAVYDHYKIPNGN
jgi:CHAD domain-containing protein